ncbi:hypothetical protein C7974DRAFT_358425 [Boeremia exigua]|uniref:uncharacterized protein n=1 Tax=Boeremia exigua TaxID=749465 RepID=UPI001E8DCCFF|nr:uncharacterized protein C7974DRAFT_358425 [Boeremia exigua]KAH6633770.1 hypothetical protein C7974DRAFT_358425 [Boeremia exigua]
MFCIRNCSEANPILKDASHTLIKLSQSERSDTAPSMSLSLLDEALYIYASVPFQGTHVLTIVICVVPFSTPHHRGQIFHHVEATYAQCCKDLDEKDFFPIIANIAQGIYNNCVSHHVWNFRTNDAWSVALISSNGRLTLITSCRQQLPIPKKVVQKCRTCSERAALIFGYVVGFPEARPNKEVFFSPVHPQNSSEMCFEQHISMEKSLEQALERSASHLEYPHINAKMKEAGFEGTSRSLKTLREETVFINQLVATVETEYGAGVASLVLYFVFDSSNYHLIRLMNRYSTARKRYAIRRICQDLNVAELGEITLPILRIHTIIREHMLSLQYVHENNTAKPC